MGSTGRSIVALLVALGVPLASGGLGAVPTARAIPSWYRKLKRPSWTPPEWLFGPAWTILYIMMGVSAWMVWREGTGRRDVRGAITLFGVQLGLNAIWTPIFFGLRAPGLALAVIVALWGMIVATTAAFFRLQPVAGALLLPYLLWTTFATALNGSIWWLNRRA